MARAWSSLLTLQAALLCLGQRARMKAEEFSTYARSLPLSLEAQAEQVAVSDVDQNSLGEDIPTDEALDVLALKRGFDDCAFPQDIVRKNKPNQIFIARNIGGRWGSDVAHANRFEPELGRDALTEYSRACARVDHRAGWERRRDRGAGCMTGCLSGASHSNAHLDNRTVTL